MSGLNPNASNFTPGNDHGNGQDGQGDAARPPPPSAAQPHDQIPMNAHWSNGMISSPTFLAPPAQFGARARGRPRHNRRGGNGRAGHHGYGGGGDLVPGPGEHVEIETISRNGQTWNKPKIVKDKPFGTIYGYHGSDKHVGVMPSHLAGGMQTPMYTGGLQAHQMYAPPHQQMYAPPHQQVYVPPAQQMYMQPAQPAQQPAQGNVVPKRADHPSEKDNIMDNMWYDVPSAIFPPTMPPSPRSANEKRAGEIRAETEFVRVVNTGKSVLAAAQELHRDTEAVFCPPHLHISQWPVRSSGDKGFYDRTTQLNQMSEEELAGVYAEVMAQRG